MRILQAAGSFPDGGIKVSAMSDPALLRSLNRIANNAYPGFRPSPAGGEAPLSPSRTVTKRAQTPTKQPGPGGMGAPQALPKGGPPPLSAFGLPKPSSPDSHLISELAREVAYLVGAGVKTVAGISSTPGQEGKLLENKQRQQQQPASPPVQRSPEAEEASNKSRGGVEGAGDTAPHIEADSYIDRGAVSGGGADFGVHKNTTSEPEKVRAPSASGARGSEAGCNVSGRPGTYLGCGVTSCGGLGVVGDHGDVAGNVPHAAFLLRKPDRHDEVDVVESTRNDDEPHQEVSNFGGIDSGINSGNDSIVSKRYRASSKSVSAGDRQEEEGEEEEGEEEEAVDEESNLSVAVSQETILMPLTLLSAREESLRVELVRRKQHYNLGGTGKEIATEPQQGQEPFHGLTPLMQQEEGKKTPASAAAADGGFLPPASRRDRAGRSGVSTVVLVDVAHSPLMASTRPAGFQPRLGWEHEAERANLDPASLHNGRWCNNPRENDKPNGGKEFVSFARPAAHWSVTAKSVPDCPAGRTRSKGVRVPGGVRDGSVVGRFACRGYLLDPTFADHNPVILHPRLPKIAAGGFSQAPEDSSLEDAVASQAAKGGSGRGGVEPYRNVVEVLGHCVGVSGERKAGKQRYFDEQGRPSSPVKFHNVYGSAEKRRQEHAEPHLIPFP